MGQQHARTRAASVTRDSERARRTSLGGNLLGSVREDGLATFFGRVEVQQHGGRALTGLAEVALHARQMLVEVVVVRLVLLSLLVSEKVELLAVLDWNARPACDALLDLAQHLIGLQEDTVAGSDLGQSVYNGARIGWHSPLPPMQMAAMPAGGDDEPPSLPAATCERERP